MVQPGAAASQQTVVPTGLQLGLGTRAASNEIIFTQGDFSQTYNPLDLVIQGNGFFQVQQANGDLAYTRAGQFQLNNAEATGGRQRQSAAAADHSAAERAVDHHRHRRHRQLHTAEPDRGANRRPDPAGDIYQSGRAEQPGPEPYQPTNASGDPIIGNPGGQEGIGTLLQGYTEQSNVSVVDEFVNLIVSQRAYEANSKVVKAADEMYQQMNNLTR